MALDQAEKDQIKADAAENKINPLIADLSSLGLVVRTASGETDYIKTLTSDTITKRDSELYTEFEKTIEEVSTIKKNSGEKATDYLKRAFTGVTTELNDLKTKADDGEATKADKARIKELEKLVADKDKEKEDAVKEVTTKLQQTKVDSEINNGLAAVKAKLKKNITNVDDILEARLARFNREFTPVLEGEGKEEKVVFKKGEDFQINTSDGKRKTAAQLLETMFDDLLDKGKQQTGGGTNDKDDKKKDDAPDEETYTPSSDVKTRSDLITDLKKQGFKQGSPEFTKLFKKHGEGLALR